MNNKAIKILFLGSLLLFGAVSCTDANDKDDDLAIIDPPDLPMFQFDEQGVPYRWETPTLSQETQHDVQNQAIGYGWKWMQTNEIQSDGYIKPEGYYENLDGRSPTSFFYIESDEKLTRYFFSDAIPAMAFLVQGFTMDLAKGTLYDGNTPSGIFPWSLFFRIWGIWQLNGRWYMMTIEPLGVRGNEKGEYDTVWGCSQYVRMSQAELKQIQEEYTFNFSQIN